MDITSSSLPNTVIAEVKDYFSQTILTEATRLLKLSRVTLSFTRGTSDTYFIISGIVREDRSHETKLVFKKRLIGTEEGPITTNCDCHQWSEEKHCRHAVALFLLFHWQNLDESAELMDDNGSRPPIPFNTGLGVNVLEYGTIIPSPHLLQGAPPSATYSSLQYLLHDKKIVNFPLPENFKGKLILKLNSAYTEVLEEGQDFVPMFHFEYEGKDGSHYNEISLFENLYLFNWKTGEALHFSTDLKEFVRKVRHYYRRLDINGFLELANHPDLQSKLEVYIDNIIFKDIPTLDPIMRVTLEPGEKKSLISVKLNFLDEGDTLLPVPAFLSQFAFLNGKLSSFKKKKDAYDFIKSLVDSFEEEPNSYKRFLIPSNRKDEWIKSIEYINSNERSFKYDGRTKVLCHYDNQYLKKILTSLYKNFSEMLFRFSKHDLEIEGLEFQLSSANLFQGLSKFNLEMTPYGCSIFYDRAEISKWSSRIRFERNSTSTKWFDLELNVDKVDLDIIKSADLEQGLALTKTGLVLLSAEQKELIRFMRKYTQYEATNKGEDTLKKIDGSGDDGSLEEELHRFVLPFNRSRIFELFELKKLGIEGALSPEEEELCEKLSTLDSIPEYPIPEHMKSILRPYQETGYHWLRFLHENHLGACLADDMGLGKTLQTITFIQAVHDQVDRILIVCPVSILLNWENEFKKFSDLDVLIYHGGDRNLDTNKKIILTSYGVMKREAADLFKDKHFDVLVLDEVQHLKNVRSLGAYAARQLNADFRICLTGTPVENDLSEFYNILDLSIPGIWGDLQFIRTTSNKKSRLLARKTATPFILRRTKGQVLTDLPPKIENDVYLELSEGEWDRYKSNLQGIKNRILASTSKKKYGEILKGLLELRQSCLWQSPKGNKTISMNQISSTKIEFLIETLEQILEEGHQAIIFSQFTTYLDIMQQYIAEKHWKYSRIDGSQSIKKRQKSVDAFQSGDTPIFLISLKAGGVGLNLTAASYVFIMDPWWNPAVETQAIDRAHRIGQENTLTVYRPIIKNSVEEKVLALQDMKRQLFKELLPDDDESLFTGKLSMKDFEHLLT
jgi:SNF2 family DNA or RNA helicase